MPARHFYAPRRVPQSFPPSYLRRKLRPVLPGVVVNSLLTAAADLALLPPGLRDSAHAQAERLGARVVEDSQRIFFDEPGLDTLLVRSISATARRLTTVGRVYLRSVIALHLDREGRAAAALALMPRRGFDSLMMSALVIGTALGHFRGGEVHARAFYDSAIPEPRGPMLDVPEGHPRPQLRRYEAPTSLADLGADIDDMYWAMAFGQAVKITRVGEGEDRRWLVCLPGTDHWSLDSSPNPADLEANFREVLNVPSAMRIGMVRAVHDAMRQDGVTQERWAREPVLICGHSQGGLIATALAGADPHEAGINVTGVLTLGAPARRMKVREDVTMLAVAHDQDVVPSTDGTPEQVADHRVTIGRRLVRPRQGALYYAHSSATYTETVRQAERAATVAPWDRAGRVVNALREFLPREGEQVRVRVYDVWQDLLEPRKGNTWDTFQEIDRPDWEPVVFAEDWAPNRLVEVPDLSQVVPDLMRAVPDLQDTVPNLRELAEQSGRTLEQWRSGWERGVANIAGELRAALDSVTTHASDTDDEDDSDDGDDDSRKGDDAHE